MKLQFRAPERKYRNEESIKEAAKVRNKFSDLSLGRDGYTQLSDKHTQAQQGVLTHLHFAAVKPDNSIGTFPVVMAAGQ